MKIQNIPFSHGKQSGNTQNTNFKNTKYKFQKYKMQKKHENVWEQHKEHVLEHMMG
jgi:hypothetical protein